MIVNDVAIRTRSLAHARGCAGCRDPPGFLPRRRGDHACARIPGGGNFRRPQLSWNL